GGLSQGCAATLVSLLTWDGDVLAAAVGMCGWLPFRKHLEDIARAAESRENNEDNYEDPFSHSDEEDNPYSRNEDLCLRDNGRNASLRVDPPMQAVAYLREELEMSAPSLSMSFQRIPLFLGHGTEDEKVPVN